MLGVVGCGTNYDKEKAEATQSKLSLQGCNIEENEDGLFDLVYNHSQHFLFFKDDNNSTYYSFCSPTSSGINGFIIRDKNNSVTGKIVANSTSGEEEILWYDLIDGKEINESRTLETYEFQYLVSLKKLHDVILNEINVDATELINWADWYYENNQ